MNSDINFDDGFDSYVTIERPAGPIQNTSLNAPVEPVLEESSDAESLVLNGIVFPREASARIRAMSAAERAEWDADRLRAQTDQLFLAEVMGLDLTANPHQRLFDLFLTKRPGVPLFEQDT